MTINNPAAFCASLWDWQCLDGCFGETLIKPTDIDGLIERNGKFLALETKLPNVPIHDGQRITFRALVNTGYFSVLFIWGHPGKPEAGELWHLGESYPHSSMDMDKLREIVERWFHYADGTQTTTV